MVRFTSFVLAGIVALGVSVSVSAAESYKLGDAVFAKKLCAGWNSSSLPKALGSEEQGGSGWIDVETTGNAPKGMQKIVSGRADCEGWTKFELLIEKQEDGSAKCTSSGIYNKSNLTWQFLPTSANWFEFALDFGMGAFYDLWKNDMIGNKSTAWNNRSEFGVFFKVAGKLAAESDWENSCKGLDKEAITEAITEYKGAQ